MSDTNLRGAICEGADLRASNFSNADVAGIVYNRRMKSLGAGSIPVTEARDSSASFRISLMWKNFSKKGRAK